VPLYWTQASGHEPAALENELHRRLRPEFDVIDGADSATSPRPAVHVLALSEEAYWTWRREHRKSDLELLNARMLAVPLYLFVRQPPPVAHSEWQIGIASPKEYRLPNLARVGEVLAPLLGANRVAITDLRHPAILAEELDAPQSRFDAVALFGEEPSGIFEQFLDRYLALRARVASPPTAPSVLLYKARPHTLDQSASQLEHGVLGYPSDLFYHFDRAGIGDGETVTTGLARLPMLGPAVRNGLPFLLCDAREQTARGTLSPCCWKKLRQALGDAALVSARALPREPEAGRLALEHALLLDAYLATRTSSRGKGSEEILRGLVLAAHLAVHGEEAPARRAQEDVGTRFDEGSRQLLAKLGLSARSEPRQRFSCDAVQLAAEARQEMAAGTFDVTQRLQHLRDRLVRALLSDPQPAAHKPGCGLTQVVDYNPYLDLAQLGAIERGARTAVVATAPFRLAAVMTTLLDADDGGEPGSP
jgi:hypothetical protein